MADSFSPAKELLLYCRFCKKTNMVQLERSIAGTGRVIDINSTFEYICTRCHRTHCFYGKDIITEVETEQSDEPKEEKVPENEIPENVREYKLTEHFLIGERITHPSYECVGIVVGKNPGIPNQILVKFEKVITTLVEDIEQ